MGRKHGVSLISCLAKKNRRINPVPLVTVSVGKETTDKKEAQIFTKYFSSTNRRKRNVLYKSFRTLTKERARNSCKCVY